MAPRRRKVAQPASRQPKGIRVWQSMMEIPSSPCPCMGTLARCHLSPVEDIFSSIVDCTPLQPASSWQKARGRQEGDERGEELEGALTKKLQHNDKCRYVLKYICNRGFLVMSSYVLLVTWNNGGFFLSLSNASTMRTNNNNSVVKVLNCFAKNKNILSLTMSAWQWKS